MAWFVFALLASFFDATYYASIKKMLAKVDHHILASGIFIFCSALLLVLAAVEGFPEINPAFYYAVAGSMATNFSAAFLYYSALKKTDLSLAIPMISFTPVFLVFTSFFMLGEFPSTYGIIGIVLIVAGSYTKNLKENIGHPLEPFREIFRNRGVFYMLLVALLYSISSNFDKIAVINSSPYFASSIVTMLIGSLFLAVSLFRSKNLRETYRNNAHRFALGGSLLAMSVVLINTAYTMQIVPYVISLTRLSILLSVFYGGFAFRERDLAKRAMAAVLMIIGIFLLMVF